MASLAGWLWASCRSCECEAVESPEDRPCEAVESPEDRPCKAVESPEDLFAEQAPWRPWVAVESSDDLREEQALPGVIKVELHLGKTVKKKEKKKLSQSDIREIISQKVNKVMDITAEIINCNFQHHL